MIQSTCLFAPLLMLLPVLAAAADWNYRVRPGDTLWDLSARYLRTDVGWQRLQMHNAIVDPYRLPPGSRLGIPVEWLRVGPVPARLVALRGEVRARPNPNDPAGNASEGMGLTIGGWLETGDSASATLEFADGSRLLVQANSRIEFDKLSAYGATGMVDTRLRLIRGGTSNHVKPATGPASHYIIQTPSATTSVRGTRFRVGAGSDGRPDRTEVLEGTVHVDRDEAGDVLLRRGHGALAGGGAPGAVLELAPAPVIDEAGSALQSLPIKLAWAAAVGADAYQVEVVSEAEQEVQLFEAITEATSIRIDDLPAGEHRLLLRAVDAHGLQGHDAIRTFTLNAEPAAPLTISPRADQVVHHPRPRFEWTRPEQASEAVLQIADAPAFDRLLSDNVVRQTRKRADDDLAPGRYWWRIASRDADGRQGPFGDVLSFEISDQPVDPGLETQAERGQVTLQWQQGAPGQRYRVQIARKPDFADPFVDREVDTPQLQLDRPHGGRWYIRVQLLDDDGYAHPFGPVQEARFPCRLCYGAGAGALLLLLVL
ncbi:FecR family protein [Marilutibacter maris]|uniref:Peptidoglycan-binding protein LysM n=1 Tax=Marilutibacter maris TaxID=1605891 RepID=A0A2U9T2C0_9GAMM|nr:FecR domain-containing protein [Lysobacter maris]AWV06786.1 peptidoglycan-binding protein LysM [Lysobacter maris]